MYSMSRATRKYTVWDSAEEAALRAGVKKHGLGAWEIIRTDAEFGVLRGRSGVQLKDKWRNLVKFHHITADEAKYSQTNKPELEWRNKKSPAGSGLIDKQYLKSLAAAHATRPGRSTRRRKLLSLSGSEGPKRRSKRARKRRSDSDWTSCSDTDKASSSEDTGKEEENVSAVASDDEEEEATCTIACLCGVDYDDGQMMVECILCSSWSHVHCLHNQMQTQPDRRFYDLDNFVCGPCQLAVGNGQRAGITPTTSGQQARSFRRSSDGDISSHRTHHTDQQSLATGDDQEMKRRTTAWIRQASMTDRAPCVAGSDDAVVDSQPAGSQPIWLDDAQQVARRARGSQQRKRRYSTWCTGLLEGADIVTPADGSPPSGSPGRKPVNMYSPVKLPVISSRFNKLARLSDEATGPCAPPHAPQLPQQASCSLDHGQAPTSELAATMQSVNPARKPPLPAGAPRFMQCMPAAGKQLQDAAGKANSGGSRSTSTLQSPTHSLLGSPPGYLYMGGMPLLLPFAAPGGSRVSADGSGGRKGGDSEGELTEGEEALVVTQRPRANSDGVRSESVLLAQQQLARILAGDARLSIPKVVEPPSTGQAAVCQTSSGPTIVPQISWSDADFHMLLASPPPMNPLAAGPFLAGPWPQALQGQPAANPQTSLGGWTSLVSPSGLESPDLLAHVLPSPMNLPTDALPAQAPTTSNHQEQATAAEPSHAVASFMACQGAVPLAPSLAGLAQLQELHAAAAQWMLQHQPQLIPHLLQHTVGAEGLLTGASTDSTSLPRYHRHSSESGDGGTLSFLNLESIDRVGGCPQLNS